MMALCRRRPENRRLIAKDGLDQKLSMMSLVEQDELGEEAEFDVEETAQMRSVRVNNYEDRMVQLQSDMQKDIDKQVYRPKKVTKERDDARRESNES